MTSPAPDRRPTATPAGATPAASPGATPTAATPAGATPVGDLPVAGPPGFRHCPRCGGRLVARSRGDRLRPHCADCGRTVFHNPAVGVAVVLLDGDRLLLARRSRSYAGGWCIPCGYVEWDEDVRLAAVRELAEETGLDVVLGEVLTVHSNVHDLAQHTVGIWFRGEVSGGELQPGDDVDAVGFFPLDDLPGPLAFPTDELVVAQLRAELAAGRRAAGDGGVHPP